VYIKVAHFWFFVFKFFSGQKVRAGACGNGRKIKSYFIFKRFNNYNYWLRIFVGKNFVCQWKGGGVWKRGAVLCISPSLFPLKAVTWGSQSQCLITLTKSHCYSTDFLPS
jgi:hypothetical protein